MPYHDHKGTLLFIRYRTLPKTYFITGTAAYQAPLMTYDMACHAKTVHKPGSSTEKNYLYEKKHIFCASVCLYAYFIKT